MVKFSILLRRRADMTHEEFMNYHKNNHGPLFTSLFEVKENVRKYTQCHCIPVKLEGLPEPHYDGITELWFDDAEFIAKVFASEKYMKIIRPDEAKFLELDKCGFMVCTENPVI